jgi:hypothetical protein
MDYKPICLFCGSRKVFTANDGGSIFCFSCVKGHRLHHLCERTGKVETDHSPTGCYQAKPDNSDYFSYFTSKNVKSYDSQNDHMNN